MAGRILYNNLFRDSSVVIENTQNGFGFAKCIDGRTSTHTKAIIGANSGIILDLGSQKSFDSFAIARHTFGTTGGTISISGSNDGITYTSIEANYSTTSNQNIFIDLGSQTYQYVQVVINDTNDANTWADMFIGPHLALERSQQHGFIRPGLRDGDTIVSNVTRGKELAGLTVKQGLERVVFRLPYYTSAWLGEFLSLRDTMKLYPIYILWDESRTETPFTSGEPPFFCWPTSELPAPRYSKNISGYYDLNLDVSGFWS